MLLNEVAEFKIYLELRKQCFKYHTCQQTFVADTSITEKHYFINQSFKWTITTRLKENTYMTGIARQKMLLFLLFIVCLNASTNR